MGKSTISMAIFHSDVSHYQRVSVDLQTLWIPMESENFNAIAGSNFSIVSLSLSVSLSLYIYIYIKGFHIIQEAHLHSNYKEISEINMNSSC